MLRRDFLAFALVLVPWPALAQSRRREERQRLEERAQERREQRREDEERAQGRRTRRHEDEERAQERRLELRDQRNATPLPPQTPTRPLDQPLPPP